MNTYTLHITGMTCDHCAQTAEDALNALPGVWAEVSYEVGIARVSTPAEVGERLIERTEAKGFKAGLSEEIRAGARSAEVAQTDHEQGETRAVAGETQ